jgi:hypothetical protein
MPFHEKMLCNVTRLEYDFSSHTGIAWSPEHSVPDMSGSLEVFTSIDPEVKRIIHIEGDEATTVYALKNGDWVSRTR